MDVCFFVLGVGIYTFDSLKFVCYGLFLGEYFYLVLFIPLLFAIVGWRIQVNDFRQLSGNELVVIKATRHHACWLVVFLLCNHLINFKKPLQLGWRWLNLCVRFLLSIKLCPELKRIDSWIVNIIIWLVLVLIGLDFDGAAFVFIGTRDWRQFLYRSLWGWKLIKVRLLLV